MAEFKYKVCDGFDKTIDEKGNTFLALRKLQWGIAQDEEQDESKVKLDLRKYFATAEGEQCSKGVSFLTEEGPHELTKVLVESGYGYTKDILEPLSKREDFISAYREITGKDINDEDFSKEEYYDARSMLGDVINEPEQ